MSHIGIPLDFWFSLIRAVPNLQWAYLFSTAYVVPGIIGGLPPDTSLLHFMRCLSYMSLANMATVPLTLIFSTFIDLPCTRYGYHISHGRIIAPFQSSTPCFVSYHHHSTSTLWIGDLFLHAKQIIPPSSLQWETFAPSIWHHVPHMTHLRRELPGAYGCSGAGAGENWICSCPIAAGWL